MALRIEPLRRGHRALLADFRNQHATLVLYLQRFATRHGERDLLSRTFVAIDTVGGTERLAGYFSLSAVSVERDSVAVVPALDRLPRFPVPGVLLARLAVDGRAQGQGLGRYLFEEALGLTLQLARSGPIGFRLLVTDAIDQRAVDFYGHFGLTSLGDGLPCRMALDLLPLVMRPAR